jgi:hypothetical protein
VPGSETASPRFVGGNVQATGDLLKLIRVVLGAASTGRCQENSVSTTKALSVRAWLADELSARSVVGFENCLESKAVEMYSESEGSIPESCGRVLVRCEDEALPLDLRGGVPAGEEALGQRALHTVPVALQLACSRLFVA